MTDLAASRTRGVVARHLHNAGIYSLAVAPNSRVSSSRANLFASVAAGRTNSLLMRRAIDLVLWESPLQTLQGLRQMILHPEISAFIPEPQ